MSATKLRGSTDTYRSEGTGRTSAELLRASLVQSLSQVRVRVRVRVRVSVRVRVRVLFAPLSVSQ